MSNSNLLPVCIPALLPFAFAYLLCHIRGIHETRATME